MQDTSQLGTECFFYMVTCAEILRQKMNHEANDFFIYREHWGKIELQNTKRCFPQEKQKKLY